MDNENQSRSKSYYVKRLINELFEALVVILIYSIIKKQPINWEAVVLLGILTFILEESQWKHIGSEIKSGVMFSVGSSMV